ncbi:acetyl/propionyl/methylcrotonyl-CoA carboxylase subunit alpha [Rathayibacter soli]|uniref:acetyl/propionyl/methylcrotonyl-CoA carboxylase subunit alpha n=1 Tax=Rathayibacter soli TaxID=3144168 RepID=UPI0027E4ACD2|nr:biotin carboxylase N-terminal domain-containing protein [Glaciibacter superstes]
MTREHPDTPRTAAERFDTVLVANRGEIACRIIRTLRRMGIRSVAVYSDADRNALHVTMADAAVLIGPAEPRLSYLKIDAIIRAAQRTGAGAVHPGYGFLSENVEFARACAAAGLVFIGPGERALETMGDKIRSKNQVAGHGVPVTPGIAEPGLDDAALIAAADEIGFPILIKPSAGGGGKGMYEVHGAAELPDALAAARRVAAGAFGDDTLFLERLVATPRHIEVQLLADAYGHVIHLGERECSLQRRHQKVIEEAPSPLLSPTTRERIGEAACAVARSVDYVGAGTVEFLVSDAAPDEFFFMEMNTRLQVEHPVTEAVTGIDLVEWQVRIAAGEKLTLGQQDVVLNGHAIEARVYAEDPHNAFLPSSGRIVALREPSPGAGGEPGIRVDSSLTDGLEISPSYDPMLAKVIAWGADRGQALSRLQHALGDTVVLGVHTNLEFLRALLADAAVQAGNLDTGLIERTLPSIAFRPVEDGMLIAAALAMHAAAWSAGTDAPWSRPTGWRVGAPAPARYEFGFAECGNVNASATVEVFGAPTDASVRVLRAAGGEPAQLRPAAWVGERAIAGSAGSDNSTGRAEFLEPNRLEFDGVTRTFWAARENGQLWLAENGVSATLQVRDRALVLAEQLAARVRDVSAVSPQVRSPMPGTVVTVDVEDGDQVEAGASVATIEAMKMEHRLVSPVTGTVSIGIRVGELVKANQIVATIATTEEPAQGSDASATA